MNESWRSRNTLAFAAERERTMLMAVRSPHEFAIVSKDSDFSKLSVIRGTPPKVIWLLLGNCTNSQIEAVPRNRCSDIEAFGKDPALGTLALC